MNKYLFIISFLSIALVASLFVVVRTTTTYQRAAGSSSGSTVLENSYLFASPLQAKADGKEMVRITVFLLDGRGLGVGNQTVSLKIPNSVTVNNQQEITDQSGKVVFDLSSTVTQTINVTATTNNLTLPQKVRVVFY